MQRENFPVVTKNNYCLSTEIHSFIAFSLLNCGSFVTNIEYEKL